MKERASAIESVSPFEGRSQIGSDISGINDVSGNEISGISISGISGISGSSDPRVGSIGVLESENGAGGGPAGGGMSSLDLSPMQDTSSPLLEKMTPLREGSAGTAGPFVRGAHAHMVGVHC